MEMANLEIKEIPVCEGTCSYKEKSCPKEYDSKEKCSGTCMQKLSVADCLRLVIFLLTNGNAPYNVSNCELFITCATISM